MPTVDTRPPTAAEALLCRTADWLWECDARGCVTLVSDGRSPLVATLAQALQGRSFANAGWVLRSPDGEIPASWPKAAGPGRTSEVLAAVQHGGATQTYRLVAVARIDDDLRPAGFDGMAQQVVRSAELSPCTPLASSTPPADLMQLLSAVRVPCWIYDIQSRCFLEVSAAAERIYGFSRQEFLGMTVADVCRPADAVRLLALLDQRACGEPVSWPTHSVHRAKSGAEMAVTLEAMDIDWSGRAARIVLVTDVTEQRQAAIELKLLYKCLESAGDIVVVTAAERNAQGDHPILYVNRAFEVRTSYTRAEVLGRDARLLQGPATQSVAVRRLSQALAAWEPVQVEMINYTRTGEPFWVDMAITPVADDRGWFHYWFAVERDITDRKLSEQSLSETNDALERQVAQRTRDLQHTVHDLEEFNRMVSHDLQNPLNGVLGLTDLLNAKYGSSLPAEASRMLQLIRHSADQMHHTIADLLSLSRISRMQTRPVPIDLSRLCTPMAATLRGRHPQLEVSFEVLQTVELWGDLQLLQLAFQQLLDNAWKYTGKTAAATVTVGAQACSEGFVVTVRDNGIGFEAATAQSLFSPFKRLRGSAGFGGTGIGLAIVARAVDRLGGWVWAEGQVGQGASFHVFLPGSALAASDLPTTPGALGDGH